MSRLKNITPEDLEATANQLQAIAGRITALKDELAQKKIDALPIDGDRQRARGLKEIEDWIANIRIGMVRKGNA